jgi:tetratricopeptide (TPR) repeat protein
MKIYSSKLMIFVILFLTYTISAESNDRAFYDAVRAEASGDLQQAVSIYENIARENQSANLHSNLANLYFKLEDYGQSILHFRKSLLINPDNRECKTNLAFALEMSGVEQKDSTASNPAFSSTTQGLWAGFFSLILWGGAILIAILFPKRIHTSSLLGYGILWIGMQGILGYGWFQSRSMSNSLKREIIVIADAEKQEGNSVALRRFPGEGSDHNTKISQGTSLFLDLENRGGIKKHHGTDGTNWYLARTRNGADKGWLREKEFGKILNDEN